ncbi:hypothetical protein M0657_006478 [Pyricularia oryzae]|nr:hypothetical protein M0657_006478 [Pyricularia oryzae]KAI7921904.1 hypothetical protein M9X92_005159 [Pyricularia oryzae]
MRAGKYHGHLPQWACCANGLGLKQRPKSAYCDAGIVISHSVTDSRDHHPRSNQSRVKVTMKFTLPIISLLASTAMAAIGDLCVAQNIVGTCQTTTFCSNRGGTAPVVGACPNDPSNVKCCLYPRCSSTPGSCMSTGDYCRSGIRPANQCPGPASYKCCAT